jgi:RHS repeat-associated protein
VSDKKIGVDANSDGVIDYYNADIVTASDYYPFGQQMPGRKYSQPNTKYRYGFNGKENDNDVKGEGNQQDYGMRIYDPRLGKFLSVDPIASEFPWNSPYSYAENDPVNFIDLDGLETPENQATVNPTRTKPKVDIKIDKDLLSGKSGGRAMQAPKPLPKKSGKSLLVDAINVYRAWKALKAFEKFEKEAKKEYNKFVLGRPLKGPSANLTIHTTDPSTLSDDYLKEVKKRIDAGTATLQDYQYQDEINKRKKEGKLQDKDNKKEKQTFTKLNSDEIEALKEKFGNGDPKYIEKLKTGSGDGAGKYDLYKDDKTGDIITKPKNNTNAEGDKTGINIKDINK